MRANGRLSGRWPLAALAAHCLGFALFWPRAFLVVDEERYVSQALAFSRGSTTIPGAEIIYPASTATMLSDYPPGTSFIQTPFVWAFGWRGAALASMLGLIVATLVTMRWLTETGKSAAFALLIPGFLGAAFFARLGMSDVPSAAIVALTCYFTFTARRNAARSFAAGFCAGASLLFRETLVVLLVPLLLGALVRRSARGSALVAGFVVGGLLRLALFALLFGSPWYLRDPLYGFSLASLAHSGPVYAFILVVLFPLGIALPFLYRGERRAELVAAVVLYLATFLTFEYDMIRENGPQKGVVLASRYVVPLLPVLAFMAADVWPRALGRLPASVAPPGSVALASVAVVLAFAVHPIAARQETASLAIVDAFQTQTRADVPVLTNTRATAKYFSPSYGPRRLIQRYGLGPDSVAAFRTRYGGLTIAILDRHDSERFRDETRENAEFLEDVKRRCDLEPRHEQRFGDGTQLRILLISACR